MAVGEAHVFPGFLTSVLTQLSFQSHWLLFSHASAEVRGKNTPERKFASTGYQTRNHQVMSLTRSPLCGTRYVQQFIHAHLVSWFTHATFSINPFPNNPWFLHVCSKGLLKTPREKEKLLVTSSFSFSHSVFYSFGEPSAIFIKLEGQIFVQTITPTILDGFQYKFAPLFSIMSWCAIWNIQSGRPRVKVKGQGHVGLTCLPWTTIL